jgi:anti-anti-sigma regulatory factor
LAKVKSTRKAKLPKAAPAPSHGQVRLGSICTIREAIALKAHLLEQFALGAPYELDGGQVERIDAAGVQLLVGFALDCLERNVAFVWKSRSAVLEQAIVALGVATLLESPGIAMTGAAG